jgi:outer membrane protein OmpA-like peptidoglycan-associated protein
MKAALFTIICAGAAGIALQGCKSSSTMASATPATDVEIVPTASEPDVRSVSVGEPQNNSAVALLLGSTLGGDPGIFISKQMDIQAEDLGQQEMEGVRIVRMGEGIKLTFDGSIMFTENSSSLSASSKKSLGRIAASLVKYPYRRVVIEGHTDGTGSAKHNQTLSEKRAEAVATYLSTQKVERDGIDIRGYGEKQPLFSNNSAQGRKQNRRVEIVILADDHLREEAKSKFQE